MHFVSFEGGGDFWQMITNFLFSETLTPLSGPYDYDEWGAASSVPLILRNLHQLA